LMSFSIQRHKNVIVTVERAYGARSEARKKPRPRKRRLRKRTN